MKAFDCCSMIPMEYKGPRVFRGPQENRRGEVNLLYGLTLGKKGVVDVSGSGSTFSWIP